jgi:hypothetical protein
MKSIKDTPNSDPKRSVLMKERLPPDYSVLAGLEVKNRK